MSRSHVSGGMLVELEGKRPQIAPGVYVAPTAVLIGDVVIEEESSVWFGAVLRGDYGRISIGRGTSVQDNTVIHAGPDLPTEVGGNVTIGHMALLEGCVIEDGVLVGMGSIVLNRARVGVGAMLAAGTVVTQGQEIPPRVLAAGVPADVKKSLSGNSEQWVETAAAEYQSLRLRYLSGTRWVHGPC